MTSLNPWSREWIDSHPLPIVSKDLLPWLHKDRREAVEGVIGRDANGKDAHDGSGLEKAQRSLKSAKAALADKGVNEETRAFLEEQLGMAQGKVDFYTGKIYLIDKVIAATT